MMMRQIVPFLIAALACVAFAPASYASGESECTELSKLISQNEDAFMTADDLAFFLATHNYDATPKDGYVQVKIEGITYKVVPNGAHPGLADLSIAL
jgi:hypothetical protein